MTGIDLSSLQRLTDAGVSIWLDDLDRVRIESGGLAQLIDTHCVRGVTTNPSIFDKAISGGAAAYAGQIAKLAAAGADVDEIIRALTTDDVRAACDLFAQVFRDSNGVDGRVSIEVDPRLAHETPTTIAQAQELWRTVGRPNALIKIPATGEGLSAITAVIGAGISVNVTLIFSVERYRSVVDAYMAGLELAASNGHELTGIESVASVFVSRIDAEIDKRLKALATPSATELLGAAAIANSRLVWAAHLEMLGSDRWLALAEQGARVQRPLWASTGVKDPAYDQARYVTELVVDGCVNTMPEATLDAVAGAAEIPRDSVTGTASAAAQVLADLALLGIDVAEVCALLETEGVAKFIDSWQQLRATVAAAAGAGA
jgi:transaldolase